MDFSSSCHPAHKHLNTVKDERQLEWKVSDFFGTSQNWCDDPGFFSHTVAINLDKCTQGYIALNDGFNVFSEETSLISLSCCHDQVKEEMLFEALTTRKTVTVGEKLIVPYKLSEVRLFSCAANVKYQTSEQY